jgi:predicted enzyme related to lactoylglutathione lyase
MNKHEKINYLELPSKDIDATKSFFTSVFGWSFTDYGPDYTAFSNAGIDGGFYKSALACSTENGSALIVFYSRDLEGTLSTIISAGGSVVSRTRTATNTRSGRNKAKQQNTGNSGVLLFVILIPTFLPA